MWEVVSNCLTFSNRLTPPISLVSTNPAKRVVADVSNCLRFSNRLTLPISLVSTNPAKGLWEVFSNCLRFSNRLTLPISLVSTNPAKRIWRSSQTVSDSQTVSRSRYPSYLPTLQKGFGGSLKLSQILKPSHAPDIPRIYQPCKKGCGRSSQTVSDSQTVSRSRYPSYLPILQKGLWQVVSNYLRFSNRLTLTISLVSTNPAKGLWEVFSNCLRFSNRLTPPISLVSTNPARKVVGGRLKLSQILKPSHAHDIPRIYQPCKKDLEVVSNCLKFSNRLMPPISRPIAEAAPGPNAV